MKLRPLILVSALVLSAQTRVANQTSVAAGKQAEIVLPIPSPRPGFIDILLANPEVQVEFVLPDGRVVKEGAPKEGEPSLIGMSDEMIGSAHKGIKSQLISGPGLHIFFSLVEEAPAGDYRVRLDGRQAKTASLVKCAVLPIADMLLAALRQIPGVKIVSPLKVRAGSQETKVSLTVTRSTGSTVIDVAPTDGRVVISLRIPDGTLVTKENAKDKGIGWEATAWPPEDAGGDDFGFGAMIMTAMMLPVEGKHQMIAFERGIPKSGRYAIEVDARLSDRNSEVSAMLMPTDSFEKQMEKDFDNLGHPALKPGETRARGYSEDPPYPTHYTGDKIDLKLGLEGAPVREPLQFRSFAVLNPDPLHEGQQQKELDLKISFVCGADGLYRGVFTPEERGAFDVCTQVKGVQKSGRRFTSTACFGSVLVQPLVARLDRADVCARRFAGVSPVGGLGLLRNPPDPWHG